ncbi:S-adenosyl-L-methionine-dependent methyltransferase, partial [Podospora conica]
MATHTAIITAEYNQFAEQYSQASEHLPSGRLEKAGVRAALGDCTGLCILDLGGGTGLHVGTAIDAGASRVDVVDISEGMLRVGKAKHASLDRVFWHIADVTQPLETQSLDILPPGSYDVVMGNWVMDHAGTDEALRGIWRNISAFVKTGGRFVGVRQLAVGSVDARFVNGQRKYGAVASDFETVEGGIEYTVTILTDPPFSFKGSARDDSMGMINTIPGEVGFAELELLKLETTDVVREDPAFWADFLEAPHFGVAFGRK